MVSQAEATPAGSVGVTGSVGIVEDANASVAVAVAGRLVSVDFSQLNDLLRVELNIARIGGPPIDQMRVLERL